MTDNGTTTRPVRTLTVKNFSVIKEATLEFGKITVLIGPQSSGKSLLCKTAYFLGKELVELAVSSILDKKTWEEYLSEALKAFWRQFAAGTELASEETSLSFLSHGYSVSLRWGSDQTLPAFDFSNSFSRKYLALLEEFRETIPSASGAYIPGGLSSFIRREDVWVALHRVLSPAEFDGTFYIPAGRSFFTNTAKGNAVLQNAGLDSITRDFSGQIHWDDHWKVGMLTTGRGVTAEIARKMTNILGGFVMIDAGVPVFLSSRGPKFHLEKLSTGTQEMVPLCNILEQLMYFREHALETEMATYDPPRPRRSVGSKPFLYLEEPEANIFPKTQYDLVQLFAWLSNDPILNFDWVITTHSPYILTAFNDLIKAGHIAAQRPDKVAEIEKIVPSKYWIKPGDFAAYAFDGKDGVLHSIMDDETKMINGDTLDDISEKISEEFGQLLEIQYGD